MGKEIAELEENAVDLRVLGVGRVLRAPLLTPSAHIIRADKRERYIALLFNITHSAHCVASFSCMP
jgi:hypothetical protein